MIAEVASIERSADVLTSTASGTSVQVSVTWLDDGSPDGTWIIEPDEVTINKAVELIVYTLTGKSTPGVQFLSSNPVVWISPPQPDNFAVDTSEDGLQLFIADRNQTVGPPQAFSFRLLAVYQDKTRISPDPTIINREPSGP